MNYFIGSKQEAPLEAARRDKDSIMLTRRWLAGAGAGTLLLLGGIAAGPVTSLANGSSAAPSVGAATTQQTTAQTAPASAADTQQDPSYTGSIQVPDTTDGGAQASEADESAALQSLATITADRAQQAALAANLGTTVVKVGLGNENGSLVYEVALSNGLDVKVDAGNGQILATDQGDANEATGVETADTGADTGTAQDQSGDQTGTDGGTDQTDQTATAPTGQ